MPIGGRPLRPWQQRALSAWQAAGERGIVEVVTGAGKTMLALACMNATHERGIERVIVVVPTTALLDQWVVALQEDLQVPPHQIGQVGAGHTMASDKPYIVAVINSARDRLAALAARGSSMLVVDECHRAGSPENAAIFHGSFAATLGMSATPESDYDNRLSDVLTPHLGPVIFRYALPEALADGVLSPFELINVRLDLTSDEAAAYARLTRRAARLLRSSGATTEEMLKYVLLQRARLAARASMRVPVTATLMDPLIGRRCIVFHEYVASASEIAVALRRRGHSVVEYHTRLGQGLRQDNLRLFKRGQVDVLVSCRALDEGLNVPDVECAVVAAASASSRQRIQRLGRVLRPAPGKDKASVYTLYATQQEEQRLVRESDRLSGMGTIAWRAATTRRGE